MENATQNRQSGAIQRSVSEEIMTSLESLQKECFQIQKLAQGPRKFFQTAEAMGKLVDLFSQPNVLDSFMLMQGSPLGFVTDRDRNGGYGAAVVRDAVIQAFLVGIFPVNNQMNIIGGKMYIPKEGFEYLLGNSPYDSIKALEYFRFDHMEFINYHPEINAATIRTVLIWKMQSLSEESFTRDVQVIFHGVEKKNNIDMAFGKAEAKMLQWLYKKLTNINIPQGDANVGNTADDTIPTTAKTMPANASHEQLSKIQELLEKVHPDVKSSMAKRIEEKDWKLTADEANSIIGPLTAKAMSYQKTLKETIEKPAEKQTEAKEEQPKKNAVKERADLTIEMYKLGTELFGDKWAIKRPGIIKKVNPAKSSTTDLDLDELRSIVKIMKGLTPE